MKPAVRAVTILCLAAVVGMAGCASRPSAPVIERAPGAQAPAKPAAAPAAAVAPKADSRPETYVVKRGDTLYAIALDHGLDYRELAELNGITNPNVIKVGDTLRIRAPAAAETAVQVRPVSSVGSVESRPLGAPKEQAAPKKPDEVTVASIDPRKAESTLKPKPELKPEPRIEPKTETAPATPATPSPAQVDDDEKVDWAWPAAGKVLAKFSDPTSKGVDIAAKPGDPVLASASGRVVYSGSGLRGYGKLVIIKHNQTYLSAYAHNSQILVKEGQNVTKGQKIAEAGATDYDAPKLHFEIRRLGKPVDPLKFLPERPS
jgi:lipoprotein NlpD